MVKNKTKSDAANVNAIQNRDIMQRMNFLWQASVYLESLPGSSWIAERGGEGEGEGEEVGMEREEIRKGRGRGRRRRRRGRRAVDGSELAKSYVQTMKSVGRKATTKMDPGVKRTLCEGCSATLVPGVTVRVRVRSSASFGRCISYTCLGCSTTRRIPAPRNNQPSLSDPSISTTEESRIGDTPDVHIPPPETTRRPRDHEVPLKEKKIVKRGRKKVVVRQQPLFARRSEGHVVFRGGEVVDMEGVYCV